jgi:predicted unusual protein kinase regulating ubiquinone biosynthesis (AarF/ABC1/UbiB family)
MSDDLNKKIKQILGQENIPDNVKGLLSLLTNSSPKEEPAPHNMENQFSAKEERREKSDLEENLEMVRKITKVMDRVGTNNDPRINLLTAIKPFLSTSRQKKVGNAIKMISMSSVARLLDENDILHL